MPSAPANHDPALSHSLTGHSLSSAGPGNPNNIGDPDITASQLGGIDKNHLMSILRNLPAFNKVCIICPRTRLHFAWLSRECPPRDFYSSSRLFHDPFHDWLEYEPSCPNC